MPSRKHASGDHLFGGLIFLADGIYMMLISDSQINFNGRDTPKLWVVGPIIACGLFILIISLYRHRDWFMKTK